MNNNIYLIGNENDLKDTIMIKKSFDFNYIDITNLPFSYYPVYKMTNYNILVNYYEKDIENSYKNNAIKIANKANNDRIFPIKIENRNKYYLVFRENGSIFELQEELICKILIVGLTGNNQRIGGGGQVKYLESYKLKKGKYQIQISASSNDGTTKGITKISYKNSRNEYEIYNGELFGLAGNYDGSSYAYKTMKNDLTEEGTKYTIVNGAKEGAGTYKNGSVEGVKISIGNFYNEEFGRANSVNINNELIKYYLFDYIEPIIHYKFNNSSKIGENSISDRNHLTPSESSTLTIISSNRYLEFNGKDNLYVNFTDSTFAPNTDFSISFWFKIGDIDFANTSDNKTIFGCSSTSDGFNSGWVIYLNNKNIKILFKNDSALTNIIECNVNNQNINHILITFSNKTNKYMNVYMNNIKIHTDVVITNYQSITTGNFFIGKSINIGNSNTTLLSTGSLLRDLRIYHSILYDKEIKHIYNIYNFINDITQCTYHYKFNNSSDVGKDSSSNEMNLLNQNFTINDTIKHNNISSLILQSAISGSYLKRNFTNYMFSPDILTISFWFKIGDIDYTNIVNKSVIMGCSNNSTFDNSLTSFGWLLYYHNKQIILLTKNRNEDFKTQVSKLDIKDKDFHLIVITFNTTTNNINIYLDDGTSQFVTLSINSYSKIEEGTFFIGKSINISSSLNLQQFSDSYMNDLRILTNIELKREDVKYIYNNYYNNGLVIIEYIGYDNKENNYKLKNVVETEKIENNVKEFSVKLKNLENDNKPYNNFNILPMVIVIIIGWIFVILTILKFISYYYSQIYIYIILYTIITLLFISSIWFLFVNNNI
jgi:hypothetical protein